MNFMPEMTPLDLPARRRELALGFAQFDGTDAAYVAFLTGVSPEDLRRVGAI